MALGEAYTDLVFKAKISNLDEELAKVRKKLLKAIEPVNNANVKGQFVSKESLNRVSDLSKKYSLLKTQMSLINDRQSSFNSLNKSWSTALQENAKRSEQFNKSWSTALQENAKRSKPTETLVGQTTFTEMLSGKALDSFKKAHVEMGKIESVAKTTTTKLFELSDGTKRTAIATRYAASNQSRFKMELLSTMFAGMQMSKFMSNYTQQTRELLGVQSLHSVAMQSVMLPVQEKIADVYREIDMALINMSDSQKEVVGGLIQITQWGGSAMAFFSQFGLAMQGIEKMGGVFGTIKTFAKSVISPFAGIGKMLGGIGKMGTKGSANLSFGGGAMSGMEKSFQKFGKKFVGMFKKLGNSLTEGGELGATNLIDKIWDGVQYLTSFLWGGIKWVGGLVGSLLNGIDWSGIISKISDALKGFFSWVKDNVDLQKVENWFKDIWDVVKTAVSGFISWVGDQVILQKVINWFVTSWNAVKVAVANFLSWVGDQVILQKIVAWFTTAWTIVKSAVSGFLSWVGDQVLLQKVASWFGTAFAVVTSAVSGLFSAIAAKIAATSIGGAIGGAVGGAAGGAGSLLAGLAIPVAAGIAGAIGIKEFLERSGIEGSMGGGWYWMPKPNTFQYMTATQAALQSDPHFKVGNPVSSLEEIMRAVAPMGGFQKLSEKFGWDYHKERMKYLGFAKGGIVTQPTNALIGEAGPEAVIPLDKLAGMGGNTYNINIDAKISSDYDIRKLAQRLINEFEILKRSSNLA